MVSLERCRVVLPQDCQQEIMVCKSKNAHSSTRNEVTLLGRPPSHGTNVGLSQPLT